jgi:hypothetical protein
MSVALLQIAAATCAGVYPGRTARIRDATPTTCGVAWDVPAIKIRQSVVPDDFWKSGLHDPGFTAVLE